jgi:hypothetical protein
VRGKTREGLRGLNHMPALNGAGRAREPRTPPEGNRPWMSPRRRAALVSATVLASVRRDVVIGGRARGIGAMDRSALSLLTERRVAPARLLSETFERTTCSSLRLLSVGCGSGTGKQQLAGSVHPLTVTDSKRSALPARPRRSSGDHQISQNPADRLLDGPTDCFNNPRG